MTKDELNELLDWVLLLPGAEHRHPTVYAIYGQPTIETNRSQFYLTSTTIRVGRYFWASARQTSLKDAKQGIVSCMSYGWSNP